MPFRAKFNYRAGLDGRPRPYLDLLLGRETPPQRPVQGLLDTGADVSCLPSEYAAILGLTPQDLEHQATARHEQPLVDQSIPPIFAQLPGDRERTFELRPIFLPDTPQILWGRDLMQFYTVSFAEREQQFTLFAP